jgi:hypothetical protein
MIRTTLDRQDGMMEDGHERNLIGKTGFSEVDSARYGRMRREEARPSSAPAGALGNSTRNILIKREKKKEISHKLARDQKGAWLEAAAIGWNIHRVSVFMSQPESLFRRDNASIECPPLASYDF